MVNALLHAATTLFAAHGPSAVSLRDVAREANVNLGLIHRYIGGKQDLLAMVLERRPGMPALPSAPIRSPSDLADLLLQLMASDPAYVQVMMRAVLDGYDVPQLQISFPLVETAATSLRTQLPRREADVRVAALGAVVFGWHAIGSLFLEVLGQEDLSINDVSEALRPALLAFLSADGA